MEQRKLGPYGVNAVALGCMNLSHAYGVPPERDYAAQLLNQALDLGYTSIDTAALYGFGHNETLIGEILKTRRDEFTLASKCGMRKGPDGTREINGRPKALRETCEQGLARLQCEVIDLYYLHRWDKSVPIEESVGEMSRLVDEGKIKTIGLSEVSAKTLRKAHKEHPIAALQSEYSLWTRNPEIATLEACRDLGTSFVAFSPVARSFLSGKLRDVETLVEKDIRRNMPRFDADNYAENLKLLVPFEQIALEHDCTMAQLAIAWVLAQGDHIIALPGTSKIEHMQDNFHAAKIKLSSDTIAQLDALINQDTVTGTRYNATSQTEIDTEEFD